MEQEGETVIRAVPCPKCRRVPETMTLENGGYAVSCRTKGCKSSLFCIGETEDDARTCWNGCIDRRDY